MSADKAILPSKKTESRWEAGRNVSDRSGWQRRTLARGGRQMLRREFLGGCIGFGAYASLGLPASAQPLRPIQVGLTPVFLTNDLDLLGNLRSYLSRAWGRDVQLITRRTYQEITGLLIGGEVDAAWICGYPYVQHRAELELLAVPLWQGKPLYRSYVIVDVSRDARTFDELAGDVHAFSDPDSNSGFLVTRDLLADRGVRPETFFRHFFYTYGHRNVVRAVASGLAQSGSVDGYVWEVLHAVEPDLTSRTRVLRRSELLGFPPIASAKARSGPPSHAELSKAFTTMSEDPEGRRVLDALRLDGFAAEDPSLFDTIAAKVEHVRRVG
jgi:phosphonate transport system substrate-binding protein